MLRIPDKDVFNEAAVKRIILRLAGDQAMNESRYPAVFVCLRAPAFPFTLQPGCKPFLLPLEFLHLLKVFALFDRLLQIQLKQPGLFLGQNLKPPPGVGETGAGAGIFHVQRGVYN